MTTPGSVALVFHPEMLGGCRVCVGVPQWLLDIRRFADKICVSDWLSMVKIGILVHMASTRRALGVSSVFDPRTCCRRSYRDAIFAA